MTGKLGFSGHPMLEHFKFLKAHTQRTPKMTIPAPSAIYGRPMPTPIDKEVYPTLDKFFDDLGQAYKKAVRAFADAGCRYLQLDEVFIAMLCDQGYRQRMRDRGDDPDFLGALYGDLINTAISDIPADMTVTMHLCRGNYKSTFMGSGTSSYDAMQEVLFDRIKVHGYFMEYDISPRWRVRAAKAAAEGPHRGPRAGDHENRCAGSPGTRSSAASRRRSSSPISTSSACRRNAASPRPKKAISLPRMSNGRSSA